MIKLLELLITSLNIGQGLDLTGEAISQLQAAIIEHNAKLPKLKKNIVIANSCEDSYYAVGKCLTKEQITELEARTEALNNEVHKLEAKKRDLTNKLYDLDIEVYTQVCLVGRDEYIRRRAYALHIEDTSKSADFNWYIAEQQIKAEMPYLWEGYADGAVDR